MSGSAVQNLGLIVYVHANSLLTKALRGRSLDALLKDSGEILGHTTISQLELDSARRQLQSEDEVLVMLITPEKEAQFRELYGSAIVNEARDAIISVPDDEVEAIEPELNSSSQQAVHHASTNALPASGFEYPPDYDDSILPIDDRDFQDAQPYDGIYQAQTSKGEGVTAYIIDSGITGGAEFPRLLPGKSFVPNDASTEDPNPKSHGTHVASSGFGNSHGIAPGANVVPIRVFDQNRLGSFSNVLAGIYWAIDQHKTNGGNTKPILNLSIQGFGLPSIRAALLEASRAGFTITLAAGNAGTDTCRPEMLAGDLNGIPNLFIVGNLMPTKEKWLTSNYGQCVNIWTRGYKILASVGESTTALMTGTSMAAPRVAGYLACMLQNASPAQVSAQVLNSAKNTDSVFLDMDLISGKSVNVPTKRVLTSSAKLSTIETKGLRSPGFISPISFTTPRATEFAGMTFHLQKPATVKGPLQLALLSHDMPYNSFYSWDDVPNNQKNPVNKAKIDLPNTLISGTYWIKYYVKDGQDIVQLGRGKLGEDVIKEYNLGLNDPNKPKFRRIGFGTSGGDSYVLSNFIPAGTVDINVPGNQAQMTDSPTRPTQTPTLPKTQTPSKLGTRTPSKLGTRTPSKLGTRTPSKLGTRTPSKLNTPQPTKKTSAPSGPTTYPTVAPTSTPTQKPTGFPTKSKGSPQSAPTSYPTAPPTVAPTAEQIPLRDGYCQIIFIQQETDSDVFRLKVSDKTIEISKGMIKIRNTNGNILTSQTLPELTTNPNVISSMEPNKYYMFQLSNVNDNFSLKYAPLIREEIAAGGRQTVEYKMAKPLREAIRWENKRGQELQISLPDTATQNIEKYEVNSCPTPPRGLEAMEPPNTQNISASSSAFNHGMQLAVSATAMLGGAFSSAAEYLGTGKPGEETHSGPSMLQMVAFGLPMVAAALLTAYKLYQGRESDGEIKLPQVHVMSIDDAEARFPSPENKEHKNKKPLH